MVWIVGAVCMILFGATLGVIGLSLDMLAYAIMGGIMLLAGIFLLVSFRRGPGETYRLSVRVVAAGFEKILTPSRAFSWSASRLRRRNFAVSGGNVA